MQYKSLHQVTRLSKHATYCISSDIQCAHTTSLPQNAQKQIVWIFYGYMLDSERIILCLYITKRHTKLQKIIFLIIRLVRLMLLIHRAHKHIFQSILGPHARCKDCLYFGYAFQRCVQIFIMSLPLRVFIFLITGLA